MATYRKPLVDKDGNYIIPVVDSMDDYSTEEVDTQRKWIDGKTIYKKTINFGALPNSTTKGVAHNISNLDSIINCEVMAYSSLYSSWMPLPQPSKSLASDSIEFVINSVNILIATAIAYWKDYTAYVTLYYTKTS